MRATISRALLVILPVCLAFACWAVGVFEPCQAAAAAEGASQEADSKKAAEPPADQHKPQTPATSQEKNHGADKTTQPAKPTQQLPEHAARQKPSEPTRDDKAREKLQKPIEVSFSGTPLEAVLEVLAGATGCQMFLDRRALAEEAILADASVSIALSDVPAEMVLGLVLGQLGLDYYIKHGVIVVTTAEKAQADLEVRVYPVHDLIEPIGLTRRSPDTEASRLTDVIQSSVEPDSWQDNGGRGTIRYYRGTLVIAQTVKTHQAVERLLSELRAATNQAAKKEELPDENGALHPPTTEPHESSSAPPHSEP